MIYNDIKYAIETGAVIEIVYKNHDGSDSVRTLSDIQYSAEYGDNYIKALCHLRNEYRTFKIDRISDLKIVDDQTDIPIPAKEKIPYEFDQNKSIYALYGLQY